MNRRLLLPLLALALLAGAFFGLRALLGSEESGGEGPTRAQALAPDSGPRATTSGPSAPDERPAAGLAATSRAAADAAAVDGDAGSEGFDLDRAGWIEGRVIVPLGAPAEPELAVVAVPAGAGAGSTQRFGMGSRSWRTAVEDSERWSRRAVEGDGRFRVPVPAGAERATLYLDARFLHLEEPRAVELEGGAASVELTPVLGGALLVRLTPPRGVDGAAEELVGADIQVVGAAGGGFMGMGGGGGVRRQEDLPEALEFEFGGLPADYRYFVTVDPKVFLAAFELDVELRPGEVRTLEFAIQPGVELSGRVVDTAGAPVEAANVRAEISSQFSRMAAGSERTAETDAEGRFRLRGVRPRKLQVAADKEGYLGARSEELRPAEGARVTGIELVLDRGAAIAGRVLLPDGGPAAEARVSLRGRARDGSAEQRGWDDGARTETDADGAFQVSGLRAELDYDLTASLGDQRQADPALLRGAVEGVRPGASDVELTLRPPVGVDGVVTSEAGAPIGTFEIAAELLESALANGANLRKSVDGADGRFRFEGAFEGRWRLRVDAPGWVMSAPEQELLVPAGGPVVVRMAPAAALSGVVLDPAGAPVEGATVRLSRGAARRGGFGGGFGGGGPSRETDAEGRFQFEDERPGSVRLRADDEDWAPSEELTLELTTGAGVADVVLTLTEGGTLSGEVYDEQGNPDAGRSVNVFTMGGDGSGGGSAVSDDAGRFTIEHLAPGQYTAMTQPDLGQLAEMEASEEELDPVSFMSSMKMKTVEIAEGQVTHVVLGAPPANPVRLFGRITEGGAAVEKGTVMAVAEGRSLVEAWKPSRVSADGTYEMTLDEPGRYVLVYQAEAFQEGGVEFPLTVPEAEEHRFDVELPAGRLEGVVFGPDGAPAEGVSVSLVNEGTARGLWIFGQGNRARSDGDGRFTFTRLRAGVYAVRAGGNGGVGGFGGGGGGGGYGAEQVTGLVLEPGGAVTGVELRLRRPGTLAGVVRSSSGDPVAGATVFVRDASGRPVDGFSTVMTDADGRFRHERLSPGEYTASARAEGAVSAESGLVRVREGDESEVALALEDGVLLRVVVEEPDGSPARVAVDVRDEAGREYGALRSFEGLETQINEGMSTSEVRVGPVPAGTYTVTVTAEDGRSETRKLSLRAGRDERKLRLRLDE